MKDSKFTPFGAKEEALRLATEQNNRHKLNPTIDNILLDADKILQWFIANNMVGNN